MPSESFAIAPRGPFSLAAANAFGFGGRRAAEGEAMRLAFAADGGGAPVGVVLRQDADGTVRGEVDGDVGADLVAAQVARILSLDHDGEHWRRIGRADAALGALQDAHPGQRPVLFHSPYEAACHAIVAARRSPRQVADVKQRLGRELGGTFTLAGEELTAWPGPHALLAGLAPGPGLEEERVRRLRGIAEAGADGRLGARRLHELGPEAATDELLSLRGIGPFSAALVVVRAVGFLRRRGGRGPGRPPGRRHAARPGRRARPRRVRRPRRGVAALPDLGVRAPAHGRHAPGPDPPLSAGRAVAHVSSAGVREVAIPDGSASSEAATFAACLATILELELDGVPVAAAGEDVSGWRTSRWLGGLGLGLVPVADPAAFAWPGPWIGRVRAAGGDRRAVVMYGVPSGVVWDPSGATAAAGWELEGGFVIAAADVALARPPRPRAPAGTGTVEAIYVAPEAGAAALALERVRALADRGLEGDRHVDGRGTFPSGLPGSALTLIAAEVCESFAPPLAPGEHRRNVVTRGIDLNALVGHEFALGAVRCRGMRLCEPCTVVERYASRPVLRALVHRGGLRADILEGGEVRVGDPVRAA
jgi:3-methyladenine DNA glycosylase/8-oxoguanine DNA glycosylase